MYLHLGQDTVVRTDEIVGIFDLDTSTVSKRTREFLTKAPKAGQVGNVSMELPKSIVLCAQPGRKGGHTLYISQISSATLLKRTGFMEELSFK